MRSKNKRKNRNLSKRNNTKRRLTKRRNNTKRRIHSKRRLSKRNRSKTNKANMNNHNKKEQYRGSRTIDQNVFDPAKMEKLEEIEVLRLAQEYNWRQFVYDDGLYWWNPDTCLVVSEKEFNRKNIIESNIMKFKMEKYGWKCHLDDDNYWYYNDDHDSEWTWEDVERKHNLLDSSSESSIESL